MRNCVIWYSVTKVSAEIAAFILRLWKNGPRSFLREVANRPEACTTPYLHTQLTENIIYRITGTYCIFIFFPMVWPTKWKEKIGFLTSVAASLRNAGPTPHLKPWAIRKLFMSDNLLFHTPLCIHFNFIVDMGDYCVICTSISMRHRCSGYNILRKVP
jgi:hypothetical protein